MIAIRCDQVKINLIAEKLICETSAPWMPLKTLEIPLPRVYAVWKKYGVAVVEKKREQHLLEALRAESLPQEEPDVIEYTVVVCNMGHPVEPIDDDVYYCPVCRRDTEEGLRIRYEKVRLPRGNWQNAETGPPVVDDSLCCTGNNIAYFFERVTGVKPDGTGSYGIGHHYNVIEFFHVDEKREINGGMTLMRGVGAVRFSDYDSPIELRDPAYYVELSARGASAWKRLRDVTLEDVLTAVRTSPHEAATIIDLAPQFRDVLCREAWGIPKASAYSLCMTCGMPPDVQRLDDEDVEGVVKCLERRGAEIPAELRARYEEVRRRREEERMRRGEERRRRAEELAEKLRAVLSGLPVEVSLSKTAVGWEVSARLTQYVEDEEFDKFVQTCRKHGLRYDRSRRLWQLHV